MTTALPTDLLRRELAQRISGGIEITLYWNPLDNTTSIQVHQTSTEETITLAVPIDRALEAFYHPFAHLAEQCVGQTKAVDVCRPAMSFDRFGGLT